MTASNPQAVCEEGNGWTHKRLGDVCRSVGGGTPSRSQPKYWSGEIPWASVKDFTDDSVVLSDTQEHITKDGLESSASTLVPKDTPVICTRMAVGRCALTTRSTAINQDLKAFLLNDEFELRFFIRLLRFRAPELNRLSIGSTVRGITTSDLLALPLRYGKKPEQSGIAAVLDTVDEAIAKTEAVIAKLRQVRAGLLHDLLTCGLDAHGQLRDPIAHPEQFEGSFLGRVPIGWDVQTLEQITDPQAPICYGIVQVLDFVSDGILVLAIRDILGDYATGLHRTAPGIDANYARSRVRPGDVLISIKGTIGRIGLVPPHYRGNISRDLARVRPLGRVSPAFLVHLLRSPFGQKTLELTQVGTTRAELSIAPLKRIAFAFPPKDEQEQIAKLLDGHDGLIGAHETELTKLLRLKSGLMTDLLTGRVRIPAAVSGTTVRLVATT